MGGRKTKTSLRPLHSQELLSEASGGAPRKPGGGRGEGGGAASPGEARELERASRRSHVSEGPGMKVLAFGPEEKVPGATWPREGHWNAPPQQGPRPKGTAKSCMKIRNRCVLVLLIPLLPLLLPFPLPLPLSLLFPPGSSILVLIFPINISCYLLFI